MLFYKHCFSLANHTHTCYSRGLNMIMIVKNMINVYYFTTYYSVPKNVDVSDRSEELKTTR
jgi:hypothetical protein